MNTMDLLKLIGQTQDQYILEASSDRVGGRTSHRIASKKLWVIAAMIATMVVLMGSAWIVRITIASNPDYPMVEPSSVENGDIQIWAEDVCGTGMHVFVQVEGFGFGAERALMMRRPGPFTLEKYTQSGWAELPALLEDPQWNADEVWTDGFLDWYVNWSAVYGVLENGKYRYSFVLLEDHEPVYCEFSIEADAMNDLTAALADVSAEDAYCVRLTAQTQFDGLDTLRESQREEILSENAVWVYEYWKSGKDLLHLVYRNDVLWVGMLYQDGIKYALEHEGDNRNQAVMGWSEWPDMDPNRMTEWIHTIMEDLDGWKAEFSPDGTLSKLRRSSTPEKYGQYAVNSWKEETWEFYTGNDSGAAEKIMEADVQLAPVFSWEEDQKIMKALDVELRNNDVQPVGSASEAIARAKEQCTVEYDKVIAYRDEAAGMWKIEFQIHYGYQGYQYIFLDDGGFIHMVAGAGSKVPEWQEEFPGP